MEYLILILMPSDPAYAEMNILQMMLCCAVNPHLTNTEMDLELWDLPGIVEKLQEAQGNLMDRVNWNRFAASVQ